MVSAGKPVKNGMATKNKIAALATLEEQDRHFRLSHGRKRPGSLGKGHDGYSAIKEWRE